MTVSLWLFASIIINALSLAAMVSLLGIVMIWRQPKGLYRWALVVFLVSSSAQIGISILTVIVASSSPAPDQFVIFLTTLTVDGFALTTIAAFILVVVASDLAGEFYGVLIRAGLVFWVLLQWPLWRGELFSILQPGRVLVHLDTSEAATYFVMLLVLAYQVLTIWFAYRYRKRVRVKFLAEGVIFIQFGHMLVLVFPLLRWLLVSTWFAVPAALMIGYGLFQERRAVN